MKVSLTSGPVALSTGRRCWDVEGYKREVQAADRAGFFSAYAGARRGRGPSTETALATNNPDILSMVGLGCTEQLRFGSFIVVLPIHHPVQVVQDACMVNAFYPGRYRLGVGAGYSADDFQAFGIDPESRVRRTEVAMRAVRAYLDSVPYELEPPYAGTVPPRDPALGDLPLEVHIGAWSPAGVRRAAAMSDGWMTGPIHTVSAEATLAAKYRAACAAAGKRPYITIMREAAIAATDAGARDRWGDFQLSMARVYYDRGGTYRCEFDPWLDDVRDSSEITLEMIAADRILIGSPDTWLSTLQSWQHTIAPDEVILRLRYFDGPSRDDVLAAIRMIGREIIPVVAP